MCSATVNYAAVVRFYINKMNESVEIVNLGMDDSLEKWDELGTSIEEAKSAGVGLGIWGASYTRMVTKKSIRHTKIILKPPKPQANKGAAGSGLVNTRSANRGSGWGGSPATSS